MALGPLENLGAIVLLLSLLWLLISRTDAHIAFVLGLVGVGFATVCAFQLVGGQGTSDEWQWSEVRWSEVVRLGLR